MRRGEIWTLAEGGDYAGRPRPAVIVQDDAFDATNSVTVCAFTTSTTEGPVSRILVEPTAENGLTMPSRLMADKLMTVRRRRLGSRLGRLADADLIRLNRAIVVFLGLASPPSQEDEA
jgi:mRNA interferase MazF